MYQILCLFPQFLGILAVVFLLQIAAGAVGYVFTDMVTKQPMYMFYYIKQRSDVTMLLTR